NPEGVASSSPGLPSAATLGQARKRVPTPKGLRRPAQGCRPRLPWVSPKGFPTPKGLRRPAQGCRPRLPWVSPKGFPTPKGLRRPARGCRPRLPWVSPKGFPTPRGCLWLKPVTQGSRGRQPWTVISNPFGVETHHSALSSRYSFRKISRSASDRPALPAAIEPLSITPSIRKAYFKQAIILSTDLPGPGKQHAASKRSKLFLYAAIICSSPE